MQPRGTSHFTSYRTQNAKISEEKLSSDIAAFERSGGTIEKLGNTPTRKTLAAAVEPAPEPAASATTTAEQKD